MKFDKIFEVAATIFSTAVVMPVIKWFVNYILSWINGEKCMSGILSVVKKNKSECPKIVVNAIFSFIKNAFIVFLYLILKGCIVRIAYKNTVMSENIMGKYIGIDIVILVLIIGIRVIICFMSEKNFGKKNIVSMLTEYTLFIWMVLSLYGVLSEFVMFGMMCIVMIFEIMELCFCKKDYYVCSCEWITLHLTDGSTVIWNDIANVKKKRGYYTWEQDGELTSVPVGSIVFYECHGKERNTYFDVNKKRYVPLHSMDELPLIGNDMRQMIRFFGDIIKNIFSKLKKQR